MTARDARIDPQPGDEFRGDALGTGLPPMAQLKYCGDGRTGFLKRKNFLLDLRRLPRCARELEGIFNAFLTGHNCIPVC
jgi:hypothetical protein